MPDEDRSAAARLVRRLLGVRRSKTARTVADLPAGAAAVIDELHGDHELLARLTAQGLAPGVRIHVVQRRPTHVIEIGHTTVAVERRVAESIRVRDGVD